MLHYGYSPAAVLAKGTGTYDNPTSREWYEALPEVERNNLWRYLKSPAT